ncbi:shikimate dehydrogenase [Irregularibacter muris]|uniref:Shikimate dehydrogenase (NADP(+)) n=1 Tax=Irregularibacter muris TaxID=1796619 RepID=A0AAE3L2X3_9FIRM|nr:shikimate dehydrogenase [Irregularibacter muris]MCR1899459.1 shikimate dehydrogenase [Irregularibacter muris]
MKQLYGLMGEKLSHSLSPAIHAEIFQKLNISAHYHLFEIEKSNLRDAILGLEALGIKGVNVTIPYKVEIMKYLDELSSEARKIGAVNTLHIEKDKIMGYNTDYHGFGMMLSHYGVEVKNKKTVILGSGGVSKAVIQYLKDEDVGGITLVSRDKNKARATYNDLEIVDYRELPFLEQKDILINCTPLGMYPYIQECPVRKRVLSNFSWIIDLIYNPPETLLLKQAREIGIQGINGSTMLVGQAIKAQEIWNNTLFSEEFMEAIHKKIFKK